jgi:hypothetical protein
MPLGLCMYGDEIPRKKSSEKETTKDISVCQSARVDQICRIYTRTSAKPDFASRHYVGVYSAVAAIARPMCLWSCIVRASTMVVLYSTPYLGPKYIGVPFAAPGSQFATYSILAVARATPGPS